MTDQPQSTKKQNKKPKSKAKEKQASPTEHLELRSLDPIKWQLSEAICAAFASGFDHQPESIGITPANVFQQVAVPPQKELGDFAFPCFRFAGPLKAKPPAIAETIKEQIESAKPDSVAKIVIEGAFVNFFMSADWIAAHLLPSIDDGSFFQQLRAVKAPKRVMIEYSQPNTHKEFHVGHMRNVALGDSLWRMYEYCGYDVDVVNYIGDEGTHIAKCLWYIESIGGTPPADMNKGEWLGKMYAAAEAAIKSASEDEQKDIKGKMSRILGEIEAQKGPSFEYWQESKQWSLASFDDIYGWLDVRFDKVFFESDVSAGSQEVVDEYLAKGVFVESDGAIGLDMKDDKLGFCIFRKSDGNTTYAAKDLALAKLKFEEFNIDKSIYVVCEEQNYHFRQVFKSLERMGFDKAKDCYHLSYAFVVVPSGKMSSRLGNVITFSQLKNSMTAELGQFMDKYKDDWDQQTIDDTIHLLSAGAIKYGMLCSDPTKEIVFDIKNWLSFEGDTGPYLLYSYARCQSILRKNAEQNATPKLAHFDKLTAGSESELVMKLAHFHPEVAKALASHKPSGISHYLFELAKTYNRFHADVNILRTEDAELRALRLGLVQCFAKVLHTGLGLLGITPVEKM